MLPVYQIACLAWLFFTMFLVSRIRKTSKVIIASEVYYSAKGLQITVELLATALMVAKAIF